MGDFRAGSNALLQSLLAEFADLWQRLRYKDYQLLCRPAVVDRKADDIHTTGFLEVETVPNFAAVLEKRGVLRWWRSAMGYVD